ncbi:hypothetical protein TNCV_471411 [Trichonephila clavipes]|nr:hypothetical protein TNCV_471411 [Trichonephila clavipes]
MRPQTQNLKKKNQSIDGDREVPLPFRDDPIKLHGRVTYTPLVTSHWRVYILASGTSHRNPISSVRGNNRSALLIPTTIHVQHLKAFSCPVTFSLNVRLCFALPTVLSIQVGYVPYVQENSTLRDYFSRLPSY